MRAATRPMLIRSFPATRPCETLRSSSASSMSRNAGPMRDTRRSPASVSATLRVVRLSNRTPRRSSIPRIVWLSAEGVTPRSLAARLKLSCFATARKVIRSAGLIPRIAEFTSQALAILLGLSHQSPGSRLSPTQSPPTLSGESIMRTWFITGAGRGFGALIVEEALSRGDNVVATTRDPSALIERYADQPRLLALPLDVTVEAQAHEAAAQAVRRFGRIDILVNNAGYGLLSAVEEASAEEIVRLYRTNVFGVLAVTRAVLPHMRRQRAGHVINISSVGGYRSAQGWGVYASTKFALEGLTEALAIELKPLGIHATVVEPGYFRTDFLDQSSLATTKIEIADYADTVGKTREHAAIANHQQPGDPKKLGIALVKLVNMEEPPVRLPLGTDTVAAIEAKIAFVGKELGRWKELSSSTDFE